MKYIAIFDIPDDYDIGCAVSKITPKGKDKNTGKDYENAYAQIEPLSQEKTEIFERFKTVDRILSDLCLSCAYDMPSFWCNNGKNYKVIETRYHQGYMQALEDIEKEVRKRFGFAESVNSTVLPIPFDPYREDGETE